MEGKTQRLPESPANGTEAAAWSGFGLPPGTNVVGCSIKNIVSASSGEAEIYLADREGKNVVLKLYHSGKRPKQEIIEKLKTIRDTCILSVIGDGDFNGRYVEIQEHAAGGSLGDRRADGSFEHLPLAETQVKQAIRETLQAFKVCHEIGIIHRDIKPGNLFFRDAARTSIVVADFGIASALDLEGGMSKRLTTTSRTEGYGAPEVYAGLIGRECDYYSLGITVWTLLTGKEPFDGKAAHQIMLDTIEGRAAADLTTRPEIAKVNASFKVLMQGLLTQRHDKRWGHAEVASWLRGENVAVYGGPPELYGAPPKRLRNFSSPETGEVESVERAAALMAENPAAWEKPFYRGNVSYWIADMLGQDRANELDDRRELFDRPGADRTEGIYEAAYFLSPGLPLKISELQVRDPDHFLQIFREAPGQLLPAFTEPALFIRLRAWITVHIPGDFNNQFRTLIQEHGRGKRLWAALVVVFQGAQFRPVEGHALTVSRLTELVDCPAGLRPEVIRQMKDKESPLYIWVSQRAVGECMDVWNRGEYA
ncbi:MAG TPA: protein kinase, partial [Leptospiraceae bacterium]|nr:protein kinase [Leptospiraceae bacterium]